MTQCEKQNLDLSWASEPTEGCSNVPVLQRKGQGLLATYPVLSRHSL